MKTKLIASLLALVLVGTDDAGVEWHVVGHVGVVDDALLQPKIFGRMA